MSDHDVGDRAKELLPGYQAHKPVDLSNLLDRRLDCWACNMHLDQCILKPFEEESAYKDAYKDVPKGRGQTKAYGSLESSWPQSPLCQYE